MAHHHKSESAKSWFSRLLVLNIVVQAGIIVTGAVVRVTASGLGCPTWPECVEGSIVPTDSQTQVWHKYVEFGNRTLTGVLFVVAIAVALAVWKETADRRLRILGFGSILGTVGQALLGGVTVLTGLNPYTVASHFLLSVAIVALTVRLWWRFHRSTISASAARRWFANILTTVSATVLVLGTLVTGSGPHSGDTAHLTRMPFDPRVITWLHADVVWLFLGLVIAVHALLRFKQLESATSGPLIFLTVSVVFQGVLGYVQHFTGVPPALVALHVLGSTLVWIATLLTANSIRYEAV